MAASSRGAVGRRLGVLVAGAVVVTALTVIGAGLSPATSPANDSSTRPRSPVPGFLLDRGRHTRFDRGQLVGVYESTESAP